MVRCAVAAATAGVLMPRNTGVSSTALCTIAPSSVDCGTEPVYPFSAATNGV
ncbi:Uncharacterised protein [Mycobacteroides abscessus subsp. abscessus]|nr:Uncharacterised protein [Mycobacteroides abscessus subsp. abscessus]